LDTLSIKPYGNRKLTHKALNNRVEMANGIEQVQQLAVNPVIIWELTFQGLYSEMLEIKSFFDAHAPGGVLFYWTDEAAETHTVRFAEDSCEIEEKFGFGDDGYGIQAYGSLTLKLRKVYTS